MPGVPPNALPKLKSFLKGMLGGKKKNAQSQSQQQQPAPNSHQKPSQQQEPQQREDGQQHPPAQTDSSAAAAAAPAAGQPAPTSKQNLPTADAHVSDNAPASSQEAMAGSGEAGSAAAPDPNVAGGPQGAQEVQDRKIEQLGERVEGHGSTLAVDAKDMDPAKASTVGTTSTKSLKEDATPTEEVESADPAAAQQQPNGAPVSGKEGNEKEKEKGAENQPPPTITLNNAATISDEKMPVMAEPPAVRPVKTAPGMSATSGPLEDFP